jgi:hypothetical protein
VGSRPQPAAKPTPTPEAPPAAAKPTPLDLFKYLKDLADKLPDAQRDTFRKSDARLRMEFIIDRLEGKKGLLKEVQERPVAPVPEGAKTVPGKEKRKIDVAETLAYLGSLAKSLPDRDLTNAIERKVDTVIMDLRHNAPAKPDGGSRE